MSLAEPSLFDKIVAMFKIRAVYIGAALILLLVFVWFGITKCSEWGARREIDQMKANVNIALQDLTNAQSNLHVDQTDVAVKEDRLKEATNQLLDAANATDVSRIEANKALANFISSHNANLPSGTTADDLQRKLDSLDAQP